MWEEDCTIALNSEVQPQGKKKVNEIGIPHFGQGQERFPKIITHKA
jgi:hypothetical protein